MGTENYTFLLVSKILEKLYDNTVSLSQIINDCKRVAKLRGDYYNLLWLDLETNNLIKKEYQERFYSNYKSKFTNTELDKIKKSFFSKWLDERKIVVTNLEEDRFEDKEDQILPLSVGEIETEIISSAEKRKNLVDTSGMHHQDKYFLEKQKSQINMNLIEYEKGVSKILSRVRTRVHEYLSNTEMEILNGKVLSSYFDKTKTLVEENLINLSTDFSEKFMSLDNRLKENSTIGFSQALLLVRIILKDYADNIYPVSAKTVICSDGKSRTFTKENYISRIWQFIYENLNSKEFSSIEIIKEQLKDLGKRIDLVYEKSCKGVHSGVTSIEAYQCVIQLYLGIGDIIRLVER